ncbi:SAM-dependent chlorinase/fluorinase [Georgenia sp. SYP-B2076]|uniref:SAM-dependent chlorinase/fluorinase n=1 Tax=Georgenia sp. SYP-B2076 TaxID=2495881 RepID=UPI000F8F5CDC|nr:SAM-dependent chlorinase/fluorinase [Georgenia sp. SYP-B2076]
MLVHLVADYGPGDLAAAEVRSRLAVHLPGADVTYTPVGPFDTVAAGFCVAQLALGDGPAERLVYHNVAPREDRQEPRPDNEGEPLLVARLTNGVLVVGVSAGATFAFVAEEAVEVYEVAVPPSGSQFRSRDAFPALLPGLVAGDRSLRAADVDPAGLPAVPRRVVAYVDGYGNLKTTWHEVTADPGTRLRVRVGTVEAEAVVGDGTFAVPPGELSFAPGSSGWDTRDSGRRRWYELLARGGDAAALFNFPTPGTPVEVVG